jgi:exopolyphosphatase/guanosine-5'-triphosphate,3'-diphosphate pyrophosphatase
MECVQSFSGLPLRVAAIDVGSNSIRQLIADVWPNGVFRTVHEARQVVRLGAGVFRHGALEDVAMDAAYDVLFRMARDAHRHDAAALRAVGTAALREATNGSAFVRMGSAIIGAPLQVISGQEEARLVQRGVAARGVQTGEPALVVDVGGGSVQLVVSRPSDVPVQLEGTFSVPLGAVRLTEMFLSTDPCLPSEVARLVDYVRVHLSGPLRRAASAGVSRMVATSATAGAIVCAVHGVKRSLRHHAHEMVATELDVSRLVDALVAQDLVARQATTGIGRRRAEVIVAGAIVIREILSMLRLPAFEYSAAGVREGIVLELGLDLLQRQPIVCSLSSRAAVA